jgi:rhamnosyltransferase
MISVVIPTYNAGAYVSDLLDSLKIQTIPHELIIIDSESTDSTQDQLRSRKVDYITIPNHSFNHGATRNLGVSLSKYEYLIFLTQDSLPARPDALEKLINALTCQDDIGMAYGRQLPYLNADILSQFARFTNYPAQSIIKSKDDIPQMGIKTCHSSNSFAAYRKSDLLSVGGFPIDTILGEDVTVAARLILMEKKVAYCAEAQVFHSHNYTLKEEFKRYFDIGVFHEQQKKILFSFSRAESEGLRYFRAELNFLRYNNHADLIPKQLTRTIAKYIGYKTGYLHYIFPVAIKRFLSMHRSFW